MSGILISPAIQGASHILSKTEERYKKALDTFGGSKGLGFPDTAYYLPVIYSLTGSKVIDLDSAGKALDIARSLIKPSENYSLISFINPVLDAGMGAMFAHEISEAIRYIEEPGLYRTKDPETDNEKIWLGVMNDATMKKMGAEFVDGTAPGFALILGAAADQESAIKLAVEYLEENLYVFIAGNINGVTLAQQLTHGGVQVVRDTRLVPLGPDISAAVFALGLVTRMAMAFGHIAPGDYRNMLRYIKERITGFINILGDTNNELAATAAGAINWGLPVIADSKISQIFPPDISNDERILSSISNADIVARSLESRGIKKRINRLNLAIAYDPSYEGERVREDNLYLEMGGGKSQATELCMMADLDQIKDGCIELTEPDTGDVTKGEALPLGIFVQVAGKRMQQDLVPVLERQIRRFISHAQGITHTGQRDNVCLRISEQAINKGFQLKDIGKILHAKFHQEYGAILDRVQVNLLTLKEDVDKLTERARLEYKQRDDRVINMTDEGVDTFYSCTTCQSVTPDHVCIISPEKNGICGAINWMDCRAACEISPTGPNQPVYKGEAIDPKRGQWKGVNEFVFRASHRAVDHCNLYSIVCDPMTTCRYCECLSVVLPLCNGIMTVHLGYTGETPSGMDFSTLAEMAVVGLPVPGLTGHSKYHITQGRFLSGDGGLLRVVWMPLSLKEEIKERLIKRGILLGYPDLFDRIADETVGVSEEEILIYLKEKMHPALNMGPIIV
jgi:acetyl-CoA synthase